MQACKVKSIRTEACDIQTAIIGPKDFAAESFHQSMLEFQGAERQKETLVSFTKKLRRQQRKCTYLVT